MADSRSFLLLDSNGAPLTTATPTYIYYGDKNGNARTPPANPVHRSGGVYTYSPSDADEAVGTIALVDSGSSAFPQLDTKAIHLADNSNQFFAFCIESADGSHWAGGNPSVGVYVDKAGASRTAPGLVAALNPYLWSCTPTLADIAADVNVRIDFPAGASQPYVYGDTVPLAQPPVVTASPGIAPELLAASALGDYLRATLPAKCTQLNLLRAAVLMTPGIGTGAAVGWLITSGMALKLSAVSRDAAPVSVTLPTGSNVTAAQLATAINAAAVPNLTAAADSYGRLVLASSVAPTSGNSFVGVGADTTGANAALGFDVGGEHVMVAPLRAPSRRGVMDGRPVNPPDAGVGFWVVLGKRQSKPYPQPGSDLRRGEVDVTFQVDIFKPEMNLSPHRSREGISSCVRAVREVLQTFAGRSLNRATAGDIIRTDVYTTEIQGVSFAFTDTAPNVLFDAAAMVVNVRTFIRINS